MAATNGGVVKAWSPGEVISITPDYVLGTAIDTMRQKLYWTSWNQIYRSEMDGTTMVETLLDTEECRLSTFFQVYSCNEGSKLYVCWG